MCRLGPAALGYFGRDTSGLEKASEMARCALREPSSEMRDRDAGLGRREHVTVTWGRHLHVGVAVILPSPV
jgi:hypothetical protein